MIEKLNKYLKSKIYNKEIDNCNYCVICNDEEYINSINNIMDDAYNLENLCFSLVINTLISILISKNKLFLHDKVNKYIDDIEDDILIINLLSHSSGINKKFKAGSNVCIDNINTTLLANIIEEITCEKVSVLASNYIFKPLDMNNTNIDNNNITTTILDLSKFIKFILNDRLYNEKRILDIKYIDMWFTPLFIDDNNMRTTIGWINGASSCLCNKVDCSINSIIYNHNSYILVDRDNELAIICLFKGKVSDNTKNNINKYIYKLFKEYNKIY